MANEYGYDYEPKMGGKYLTLKEKGDIATIRIVSTPLHKTIHWVSDDAGKASQVDCEKTEENQDCQYCNIAESKNAPRMKAKEIFGWIILDRDDKNKPKIFKGGTSIYLAVRGLSKSKAWGDPQTYDIEIIRTEEKPLFYSVTPLPNKEPISKAEKEALTKANYDLDKELGGTAEPTNSFGKGEEEEIDIDEISEAIK